MPGNLSWHVCHGLSGAKSDDQPSAADPSADSDAELAELENAVAAAADDDDVADVPEPEAYGCAPS